MHIFTPSSSVGPRPPPSVDATGMGTPRPLKKLLRSDWARAQLCRLGAWYIRLVWVSGRWTVTGDEVPRRLWRAGQPFILCFWHGRLLMMPYCWRTEATIKVLVSHHRDGQITARTVGHFGIEAFAGSIKSACA